MDAEVRDLHQELNPEKIAPELRIRQAEVVTYHAGPPRSADIKIAGGTNPVRAWLLECCAALTAADYVWVIALDEMYLILSRER